MVAKTRKKKKTPKYILYNNLQLTIDIHEKHTKYVYSMVLT